MTENSSHSGSLPRPRRVTKLLATLILTAATIIVLFTAAPTSAQATTAAPGTPAAGWSDPSWISKGTYNDGGYNTSAATAPSGRTVVVFTSVNAVTNHVVHTTSSQGGKSWTTPIAFSDPDYEVSPPSVAVNAQGVFVISWVTYVGGYAPGSSILYLATSTDGITWSAPVRITGVSDVPSAQSLSAGAHTFALAWRDQDVSNDRVRVLLSTDGLSWNPADIDTLKTGDSFPGVTAAVAPDDSVTVAWSSEISGSAAATYASTTTDAGSSWDTTGASLTNAADTCYVVGLAITPNGRRLILVSDWTHHKLLSLSNPSGAASSWLPPVAVDGPFADMAPGFWQVITTSDNRFVVAYSDIDNAMHTRALYTSRTSDGAEWTDRVSHPFASDMFLVALAVDNHGNVMLNWLDTADSVTFNLKASNSSDGAQWQAPVSLFSKVDAAQTLAATGWGDGNFLVAYAAAFVLPNTRIYAQYSPYTAPALASTGSNPAPWLAAAALALIAGCALTLAAARRGSR